MLTWSPEAIGGVNEVVFALANQVRRYGYVPIIAIASWEHQSLPQTVRGVEVVSLRLREPISSTSPHRWFPGAMKTMLPDIRALLRIVRSRNVVVLNPHFPSLGCSLLIALRRLRLLRIPVLTSFHGADVTDLKLTTGIARILWRGILRFADRVVVVSDALRNEIATFLPEARIELIHNGVAADMFWNAAERRGGTPTILHIGKFEHKKAQDLLLHVFRRLLDNGSPARLVLIGATGPTLDETRSLVAKLRLAEHVTMQVDVPHERVPEFFKDADVFVLPSRSEPFGLVLLEAGAAGVPIIATSVGGIPEIVKNEETALLVAPDDADALEGALRRLLTDSELQRRLRNRMREEVLAKWSWDVAGRKYCELLTSLGR